MRTIKVADDVYEYLLLNAEEIGEGATSILRRLLKLPSRNGGPSEDIPGSELDEASAALAQVLTRPPIATARTATEKYLQILGFVHRDKSAEFDGILNVSGRQRVYFARTKPEIARSGRSTHPRQIPGSEYWAMTNADTDHKQDILGRVLEAFGYNSLVIRRAVRTLSSKRVVERS